MAGIERLALKYCAGLVAGSDFNVSRDVVLERPRRLGVEGPVMREEEGVEGVGILESEGCAE